jgi:hypothetical protein
MLRKNRMKTFLKAASFIGLALTIVPAFLVYHDTLTWDSHALLMLVGTVLWFLTAPFWMRGAGGSE